MISAMAMTKAARVMEWDLPKIMTFITGYRSVTHCGLLIDWIDVDTTETYKNIRPK